MFGPKPQPRDHTEVGNQKLPDLRDPPGESRVACRNFSQAKSIRCLRPPAFIPRTHSPNINPHLPPTTSTTSLHSRHFFDFSSPAQLSPHLPPRPRDFACLLPSISPSSPSPCHIVALFLFPFCASQKISTKHHHKRSSSSYLSLLYTGTHSLLIIDRKVVNLLPEKKQTPFPSAMKQNYSPSTSAFLQFLPRPEMS